MELHNVNVLITSMHEFISKARKNLIDWNKIR